MITVYSVISQKIFTEKLLVTVRTFGKDFIDTVSVTGYTPESLSKLVLRVILVPVIDKNE